jgi:small subunit ribosomal protein S17
LNQSHEHVHVHVHVCSRACSSIDMIALACIRVIINRLFCIETSIKSSDCLLTRYKPHYHRYSNMRRYLLPSSFAILKSRSSALFLSSLPIGCAHSFSSLGSSKEARLLDIDSINKEYQAEIEEVLKKAEERKQRRQEIVGIVSSAKTSKTINVTYYHNKFIKKYNCVISVRRKVMAHDEAGICGEGDLVRVVPCPPKSRRKRHILIDLIKKAKKIEDSNSSASSSSSGSATATTKSPK